MSKKDTSPPKDRTSEPIPLKREPEKRTDYKSDKADRGTGSTGPRLPRTDKK